MKKLFVLFVILLTCSSILIGCAAPAKVISPTASTSSPITPTSVAPTTTATLPAAAALTSTTASPTTTTATTTTTTAANTDISLPAPAITAQSVETCLNSRESTGTLTGTLTIQQLSNILWAAGKAPMVGPSRKISIATQSGIFGPGTRGTYSYNPDSHSLTKVSNTFANQSTFKISWDVGQNGLTFDAGLIYMPALLAAISSWGSSSPVSAWPKQLDMLFGADSSLKSNSECVAHCSVPQGQPGWLPDPATTGTDKIADVLANLKYTQSFSQTNLTTQQISQILWAGYGCTPHKGTKGITTPSAMDQLYLTGTIYLANENGVFRYQNRQATDSFFVNPNNRANFFNTRDHRLEQIGSTDIRANLKSAVSGLPQAPCYVILSLDDARLGTANEKQYANLETGFVASNYLLQASAMGMGCNFKPQLTSGEQGMLQSMTGIPASHKPQIIVSMGGTAK